MKISSFYACVLACLIAVTVSATTKSECKLSDEKATCIYLRSAIIQNNYILRKIIKKEVRIDLLRHYKNESRKKRPTSFADLSAKLKKFQRKLEICTEDFNSFSKTRQYKQETQHRQTRKRAEKFNKFIKNLKSQIEFINKGINCSDEHGKRTITKRGSEPFGQSLDMFYFHFAPLSIDLKEILKAQGKKGCTKMSRKNRSKKNNKGRRRNRRGKKRCWKDNRKIRRCKKRRRVSKKGERV